jgi:hypothetical protein
MIDLWTVGYETMDIDTFVTGLQRAGVERLLDVRATPRSRRGPFKKGPLSKRVSDVGMDYVSVPAAGAPRDIRGLERDAFVDAYRLHLVETGGLRDVLALLDRPTALLCREADPGDCHRSILAAAVLEKVAANVRHLPMATTTEDTGVGAAPDVWLAATNRHTADCGTPPRVAAGGTGYTSYFENEFGEQAVFQFDEERGTTVRLGDAGWDVAHPVSNGIAGGGMIATQAEEQWIKACWTAATRLRGE